MNSQKLSEPLHNLIMKSEPALAELHRIPDATDGVIAEAWELAGSSICSRRVLAQT